MQNASELKTPVYIVASRASKSAIEAIEATGGKVVCKYYNELALRDCVKGRTDRVSAAPTTRKDIGAPSVTTSCPQRTDPLRRLVWYGLYRNRGFMSSKTLQEVGDLPWVEERWKALSEQLGVWRKQKVVPLKP